MTRAQVIAAVLLVVSGVNAYLLTQQLVVLPPLVQLVLGVGNVVVTTLALYLKVNLPGQ